MSVFTKTATQTRAVHAPSRINHVKRRWVHGSLRRQAILMPAMSPLMNEGTLTRWTKKEGEAFAAGDILLQIESDIAIIDVEAISPGILGKILTPDGTTNVPVEQVIALVAKDASELAALQSQSLAPTPPPFISTPAPPSSTISPRYPEFKLPLLSPRTPTMSPRTPSLFEMHTMGYGQRSAHIGGPRGTLNSPALRLDFAPCPSPCILQEASTPVSAKVPMSAGIFYPTAKPIAEGDQLDGAAIRRMIVSNLSASRVGAGFDELA